MAMTCEPRRACDYYISWHAEQRNIRYAVTAQLQFNERARRPCRDGDIADLGSRADRFKVRTYAHLATCRQKRVSHHVRVLRCVT